MGEPKEPKPEMTYGTWLKVIGGGVAVLKFLKLRKLVHAFKYRARFPLLRDIHLDIVHGMRCFAVALDTPGAEVAPHAHRLCTRIAAVMRFHLGLKPNELHCCLKVIVPQQKPTDAVVIETIARSDPDDDRGDDHEVREADTSTIYCSLMGKFDGKTKWSVHNCFCSNNLPLAENLFKCDREDWQQYYRSSLVFPLRFISQTEPLRYSAVGFLCFDSPRANAFHGMPDIFKFRDRFHAYHDQLQGSATFHLGAIFADTLSMFIRPAYNRTGGTADVRFRSKHTTGTVLDRRSERLIADTGATDANRSDSGMPSASESSAGGGAGGDHKGHNTVAGQREIVRPNGVDHPTGNSA
jgi:hypothetical protein